MNLSIKNLSRRPRPQINFHEIAEFVLGANYELSLVLVSNARARVLNRVWRGQDQPANILSFPLDRTIGEIFLNLDQASGIDLRSLFIHGLLHLKGLRHGSKMESLESQLAKHFQTHEQNDRSGPRCRQRLRARGRLRIGQGR